MISLETRDSIDDIATDIAVLDSAKERRQAINMALLEYAEKLEEKDKEINDHNTKLIKVHSEITTIIDDFRKERNNLMDQLESKDRELAHLKEIAEKMNKDIKAMSDPNQNFDDAFDKAREDVSSYESYLE